MNPDLKRVLKNEHVEKITLQFFAFLFAIILFRVICIAPIIDRLDDIDSALSNIGGSIDVSGNVDTDILGTVTVDSPLHGFDVN